MLPVAKLIYLDKHFDIFLLTLLCVPDTDPKCDLSTRLEETSDRMRKLSDMFTSCEQTFSHPDPEPDQPPASEPRSDEELESRHTLTRTTQIIGGKTPLDEVVERMIQTPPLNAGPNGSEVNNILYLLALLLQRIVNFIVSITDHQLNQT